MVAFIARIKGWQWAALLAFGGLLAFYFLFYLPMREFVSLHRERARRQNRLKTVAIAIDSYCQAKGHYPPAYVLGPDGKPWHSWRVLLLPYLDANELYAQYDFNEPWNGPKNRSLASRMPDAYGDRDSSGNCNALFLAVTGPGTLWPGANPVAKGDVLDDPSTTIILAENLSEPIPWMEPRDLPWDELDLATYCRKPKSHRDRYTMFASLWDVVHSFHISASDKTSFRAMTTIAGRERIVMNLNNEFHMDGFEPPKVEKPPMGHTGEP